MATKRKFQLLAAVEDQPGVVAPGLVAVGNAQIVVTDPVLTFDRETYAREVNRTSLSPLTDISGIVEATYTCRVEMTGTNQSTGTKPDWSILLEACGFKQQTLGVLRTVGAMGSAGNGAIFSRETVTSNFSGSPTAEAVHDMWDGSTRFYYANPSAGLTGTTLLAGGTSGATFPVSSPIDTPTHGVCWRPLSEPSITITGTLASGVTLAAGDIVIGQTGGTVLQCRDGWTAGGSAEFLVLDVGEFISASETYQSTAGVDQFDTASSNFVAQTDWPSLSLGIIEDGVRRVIMGCRGSVTFTAEIGQPVFMDFEFRGLISSITDGLLSGTVTPTSLAPPSFLEIGYGVAKNTPLVDPADEHEACITSMSLEFRNEIAIERCAASTDGTRGAAFATARTVSGSINPSVRPESTFPWLDVYRNGTIFRQRITVGSAAANQFHMSVPACQITSEGAGERDGLATRDLQYSASGQQPDGVDGEDREVALSLHQSTTFVR